MNVLQRRIVSGLRSILKPVPGLSRRNFIFGTGEGSRNVQKIDLLFDLFRNSETNKLHVGHFLRELHQSGFKRTDPRIRPFIEHLQKQAQCGDIDTVELDEQQFSEFAGEHVDVFIQAFQNDYVIADFAELCQRIQEIYWKCKDNKSGNVADYIPQLKKMSPDYWGVSICTVDGQRFSFGDTQIPFTIQSTGKPINYGIALCELGANTVHKYIGQEPSGRRFNKLVLDDSNKPHNPMVNAGAIVVCSLLLELTQPNLSLAEKFEWMQAQFSKMVGGEYLAFSPATFLSEKETADRNFAIGYYLKGYNCFPARSNLKDVLDFYFQLCSLEVTAESLSIAAATLANGGICPTTREQAMQPQAVRDVLSLMHSCGMYDYSGQFAFRVGLPSKSGVSGSIMVVIPNVMGITVWSPPLDMYGNSSRGVQFCQELVNIYNFHQYDNLRHCPQKLDPRKRKSVLNTDEKEFAQLLFAVAKGDLKEVKRRYLSGLDMNRQDYDGRTALHIAATQGKYDIAEFLVNVCKVNPSIKDRWNNTPLDNAKQFGYTAIVELLSVKIDFSK